MNVSKVDRRQPLSPTVCEINLFFKINVLIYSPFLLLQNILEGIFVE